MRGIAAAFTLVSVLTATMSASGQTKISLRTQAKDADFADFASTRPAKVGTALPVTCSIGELFFDIDAEGGQNLYGCAATNTWKLQSGSSVATGTEPPATCSVGELFFDTDAPPGQNAYGCTGVNVWKLLGDGPNVGSVLPPTCSPGELFFDSNATAGLNLYGCTAQNTWMLQGDGGAADGREIKNDGVPVGTRPTHNYLPGTGIITTLADTGTEITIQQAVNTSVIETRASAQAGTSHYCTSNTGSDAYSCTLAPALTAYTTGMVVVFDPDVNNAGAATLDVDSLGDKAIKVILDGTKADLSDDDIDADSIYVLSYDGVDFLVSAGMETTSADKVAPKGGQYLVLATDPGLSGERVISPQGALHYQDTGVDGNYNLYYAVTSTQSLAWEDFFPGQTASQEI
ncbi:hypothetical protein JXD38_00200, partial [candidate division WOR-3 bacterium]|nr:hypothetical protein [candidate division WOR-3 bacterium]